MTIFWNEVTVRWNEVTMERSDRIPSYVRILIYRTWPIEENATQGGERRRMAVFIGVREQDN